MMNKVMRIFISFCAAFLLQACGAQPAQVLQPLPKSYSTQQCYVSEGEVNIWLEEKAEWDQLPAQTREAFSHVDINWQQERILLLSEGQKPSAGYDLKVEGWLLEQDYWQARKLVRTPAPDSLQAQMITSPCLLLVLPKTVKSFTLKNAANQEIGRWPY